MADRGRRPQMDGLRALCFLAVFFFHDELRRPNPGRFAWGYAGVYVFFALSGFLVAGLLDRLERGGLGNFYVRRFLRICPLYYLALAIIAASGPILEWRSLAAYTENFRLTEAGGVHHPATGHFWTLAIEFQFYLLFPVIFLATPRSRRVTLVVVLLAASKIARIMLLDAHPGPFTLFLTPICVEYLLWGVLFSLAPRPTTERQAVAAALAGFALLAAWTLWRSGFSPIHGYGPDAWFTILGGTPDGLGSALLVYGLWWSRGRLAAVLAWAPIVYLGTISYGLYVWHMWAIEAATHYSRWVPDIWRSPWVEGGPWPISLALTVAISALCWHFFERPILSIGRRSRPQAIPPVVGPPPEQAASSPSTTLPSIPIE
jgi:peptidoglycan/LPS O-acetylase OafA/YrhL